MNKSEELIYQYQLCRNNISKLNLKRSALIKECDRVSCSEINGRKMYRGEACLSALWEDGESEFYQEVLEEFGCDACKKSFAIKRGPLMNAKKELGNIKRKIASLGKKLIKEQS